MATTPKKGLFGSLTAPLRIQSLWKTAQGSKNMEPRIAACTELLGLLTDDSTSPSKGDAYKARADSYASHNQYAESVEDLTSAAVFYRQKKNWEAVEKCEAQMRICNNLMKHATLDPASPKARLWWNIQPSNVWDMKAWTEEKMHALLAYLGDPDPDIRARANQIVANLPFYANRTLVDWLISFYRDHLEGDERYTGLRALRQIGRLMHMAPTDSIPFEISLLKFGVTCAFANCTCAFCGWLNTGIPVPAGGLVLPYYAQKDDRGAYAVPAICDHCNKEFYVVWDANPE